MFQVSAPWINCFFFCVASSALLFLTTVLRSHLHSCSHMGPWEFYASCVASLFSILPWVRRIFALCLAPRIHVGTKTTHEKIPCFPAPAQPRGFLASLRVGTSQKPDGNICVKPPTGLPEATQNTPCRELHKCKELFEGILLKVLKGQLPKNNQEEDDFTNLRITKE